MLSLTLVFSESGGILRAHFSYELPVYSNNKGNNIFLHEKLESEW